MENHDSDIETPLREAMRRGRTVLAPGFTDRALQAVGRDVRRRRMIRWVSFSAPLAGCAAALLVFVGLPSDGQVLSERDLAQLVSLHDEVTVVTPRLDDADALTALVLADS